MSFQGSPVKRRKEDHHEIQKAGTEQELSESDKNSMTEGEESDVDILSPEISLRKL